MEEYATDIEEYDFDDLGTQETFSTDNNEFLVAYLNNQFN